MSKKKKGSSIEEMETQLSELQHRYDYDLRNWDIEMAIRKFVVESSFQEGSIGKLLIPEYQRKFIWKQQMQCDFIESLFLGIPILPLMAFMLPDGNYELIDGVQRLSTIKSFLDGELTLQNLSILDTFNGYSFTELPPNRQRKFNGKGLRFYILSEKADPNIRADIFNRLNKNGERLRPAEVRKGVFMHNEFYKFVLDCTDLPLYKELFSSTKNDEQQRGEKEELMIRFFAYSEDYHNFKHEVDPFLNTYIDKKGKNGFSEEEKNEKLAQVRQTLSFVKQYIPNGFRKTAGSSIPRVRFDAIAVGVHLALKESPNLVPSYVSWIDSVEFKKHTTSDASNNRSRLVGRIEFVRDCLLGRKTAQDLHF